MVSSDSMSFPMITVSGGLAACAMQLPLSQSSQSFNARLDLHHMPLAFIAMLFTQLSGSGSSKPKVIFTG